MFLNDLRGQQVLHGFREHAACVEHVANPIDAGPDDQLIADCRSFTCQMSVLLNDIEHAAGFQKGEQGIRQTLLCEAEDQALNLVTRIADVRASTNCGVQSKHAVADFMLAFDWHDEPSPYRDALLHSFVLDAARLQYPAKSGGEAATHDDLDATTSITVLSNACLAGIKELAASFTQRDLNTELGRSDPDDLDTTILTLTEQKKTAIKALIGAQASSASAIHAKRFVLRRLLEIAAGDGDAHDLRVELALSYFSDLNIFFRCQAQEHEPSSAYGSIWNTLTSKLRWFTSATPHR